MALALARIDDAAAGSAGGPPASRMLPSFDDDRLRALGLTRRELAVLELVASGRTNDEVAGVLVLSPLTVKTHLERMAAKLGVSGRAALVAVVWQRWASIRAA